MNVHDSVEAAVTREPVDGVLLLHRVRAAQSPPSRARRAAPWVAAAAGVAAVAVAASVLAGSAVPQPAVPDQAAAVPAGQQAVTWHGVQVLVPDGWKLDDTWCGTAQSDTVIIPGIVNSCLPPYVTGLTVVEFRAGTDQTPPDARPVEVSGQRGLRGTVPLTEEDGVRAVLVLPEQDVTVSVRSPDPAAADALLDSAAIVEADALGCPARLPGTQPPAPEVPGAADRVIPGRPKSVVVCQYGDLRIERSGAVPADKVAELQAVFDAAPTGPSASRAGITVAAEICPELERAPVVLIATYADGQTLQVFARLNSCTGPDPDNGARQVRVEDSVIGELVQYTYGGQG